MITKGMIEDFFWKLQTPKTTRKTSWGNKELISSELEAKTRFFHNDLATLLRQGPIKKTPTINSIKKIEIENTPEMDAQIKEIFWENSDSISF
jgi:hypothetical protein